MKGTAIFALIVANACSFQITASSLEDFCPHFSTNAIIKWQAPMDQLPKEFWIYKRLPPRPFSEAVIHNAIILAGLESKGFPTPSYFDFNLWEDKGKNYLGPVPVYFSINPKFARIYYYMPHPNTNITGIPSDELLIKRAQTCALRFAVDAAEIKFKGMTYSYNHDEDYNDLTNQICGRGVFLARQVDGISFFGNGNEIHGDGLWIDFGSRGIIRAFSFCWPDLKREESQKTASAEQIIACIRAFKTMTLPIGGETTYFQRIKTFAAAKALTITKVTPYYREGVYGQMAEDNEPSKLITPLAELEAVVDFGSSNVTVRLLSPILSAEAVKLAGSVVK